MNVTVIPTSRLLSKLTFKLARKIILGRPDLTRWVLKEAMGSWDQRWEAGGKFSYWLWGCELQCCERLRQQEPEQEGVKKAGAASEKQGPREYSWQENGDFPSMTNLQIQGTESCQQPCEPGWGPQVSDEMAAQQKVPFQPNETEQRTKPCRVWASEQNWSS